MKHKFLHTPLRLGAVVRETRAELGLTQADLARRAGVGRRFIVDLEAGHDRAELGKVLSVLSALGIHALALPAPPTPEPLPADFDLEGMLDGCANPARLP